MVGGWFCCTTKVGISVAIVCKIEILMSCMVDGFMWREQAA